MWRQHRRGFTLIELLISIAMIGILAMVGTGSYIKAQQRARDAKRIDDVKTIQVAQEQYYLANNQYSSIGNGNCVIGTLGSILTSMPTDPQGQNYTCNTLATNKAFCVQSTVLESRQGNCASCSCAGTDCTITIDATPANNNRFCVKNNQ